MQQQWMGGEAYCIESNKICLLLVSKVGERCAGVELLSGKLFVY